MAEVSVKDLLLKGRSLRKKPSTYIFFEKDELFNKDLYDLKAGLIEFFLFLYPNGKIYYLPKVQYVYNPPLVEEWCPANGMDWQRLKSNIFTPKSPDLNLNCKLGEFSKFFIRVLGINYTTATLAKAHNPRSILLKPPQFLKPGLIPEGYSIKYVTRKLYHDFLNEYYYDPSIKEYKRHFILLRQKESFIFDIKHTVHFFGAGSDMATNGFISNNGKFLNLYVPLAYHNGKFIIQHFPVFDISQLRIEKHFLTLPWLPIYFMSIKSLNFGRTYALSYVREKLFKICKPSFTLIKIPKPPNMTCNNDVDLLRLINSEDIFPYIRKQLKKRGICFGS